MKKLIMLFLLSTICLCSVSASAISQDAAKILKDEGFNGSYYDRDLKCWTVYKNGDLAKNCWGYDGYHNEYAFYVGDNFRHIEGWKEIDGKTYYFNRGGMMQTVSRKIDGVYRTFASDGHLIK